MRFKSVLALFALGAVGLLAVACEEGNTIVNTPGSTTTGITVSGTGSAFGAPDLATLTLGVQAEAQTVAGARETAATTAQAVIDSVKRNGVADRDVRTVQFTVEPLYEPSRTINGTPSIRGYRVTNVVSVNVRKVEDAGKIIDDAVTAGGNNAVVRNISFTIDDVEELQQAARQDAMRKAKEKAQQLAREAGVDLGDPISIIESAGYSPDEFAPQAAALRADTASPIESGELEVNITVTVLYEIR